MQLFAKNPVKHIPYKENTVHKKMEIQSKQFDGSLSILKITINEKSNGIIWLGFDIDGKWFAADFFLKEFRDELNKISI